MADTPGDGIRSLKTSPGFRLANFELYMKPNLLIMGVGIVGFTSAVAYLTYMKSKYESMGYYVTQDPDGQEHFEKRKSKWD